MSHEAGEQLDACHQHIEHVAMIEHDAVFLIRVTKLLAGLHTWLSPCIKGVARVLCMFFAALVSWVLQTLERSYLLRVNGKVVERPQHMLMRVSVGMHQDDIESAIQTYHTLSERWFTHASPTLFNAGTPRPQLSSCFLICMKGDSIEASKLVLSQANLSLLCA